MSRDLQDGLKFIFTWKLFNYPFNGYEYGQYIRSPSFCAESLGGSKWSIDLYPCGFFEHNKYHVACFLRRNANDKIDKNFPIDFKIEIIKPGLTRSYQMTNCEFDRGQRHGWYPCMSPLRTKSNLTVRCTMSRHFSVRPPNECEIHTKINNQDTMSLVKSDFFSSRLFQSKEFNLPGASKLEVLITAPEDKLTIIINRKERSGTIRKENICCVISLLNEDEHEIKSKKDSHLFEEFNNYWTFPDFITKDSLKCEPRLEDGKMFTLMFVFFVLDRIGPEVFKKYSYNASLESNSFSDLRETSIIEKCCDVNLLSGNLTIPAHRSVLAARSPVFKEEMLNNGKKVVNLDNMNSRTLELFLKFMYTGQLRDVDVESAINLLPLADKYQIPSLREQCSSFVLSELSERNACQVLALVDTIGDNSLKETAINYILINSNTVLTSSEWSQWIKNNAKLATEVFTKISTHFSGSNKTPDNSLQTTSPSTSSQPKNKTGKLRNTNMKKRTKTDQPEKTIVRRTTRKIKRVAKYDI